MNNISRPRLNTRQNRLITAALFTMTFLLGFEASGFQLIFRFIYEDMGLLGWQRGTLISAQYVAIILSPSIVGFLAEKFNTKKVLLTFGLLFAGGCFLVSTGLHVTVLIWGFFIIGCGYSVCEFLTVPIFTEVYGEKANRYMNLSQSTFCLGAVLSPQIVSRLIEKGIITWTSFFFMTGILFLLPCVLVVRWQSTKQTDNEPSESSVLMTSHHWMLLIGFVIAILMYGSVEVGFAFHLESFSNQLFGSLAFSARILSLFWFAMILSRLLSSLFYRLRRALLVISYFGAAVVIILLMLTDGERMMTATVMAAGFFLGPIWPNLMSIAAESTPRLSVAAGLMNSGSGLGATMIPFILNGMTGSITAPFAVITTAALIGTAFSLLGVSRQKQRVTEVFDV